MLKHNEIYSFSPFTVLMTIKSIKLIRVINGKRCTFYWVQFTLNQIPTRILIQALHAFRMSHHSFLHCWITQRIISPRDRPRLIFRPFSLFVPDKRFWAKKFFFCSSHRLNTFSQPGARFSKLPVITGPVNKVAP